jgi:hypothetical protein
MLRLAMQAGTRQGEALAKCRDGVIDRTWQVRLLGGEGGGGVEAEAGRKSSRRGLKPPARSASLSVAGGERRTKNSGRGRPRSHHSSPISHLPLLSLSLFIWALLQPGEPEGHLTQDACSRSRAWRQGWWNPLETNAVFVLFIHARTGENAITDLAQNGRRQIWMRSQVTRLIAGDEFSPVQLEYLVAINHRWLGERRVVCGIH